MNVSNDDLCTVLYKIRDLINQGEFDTASAMANDLKRDLAVAYVEDSRVKCNTTCEECKKEYK